VLTTRDEARKVLIDWTDGVLAEQEVWQWAQRVQEESRPADDLVRDIIDNLAVLPFDFITVEDAQVMLDALANPLEETDLSVNLLWNYLDMVNSDSRRYKLADHPFYGQFVDGAD